MNRQSPNQGNPQTSIELRIRTMRMLWTGMLLSIGVYYVFLQFVGRSVDLAPNPTLSLTLIGVAVVTTLISFLIKSKLLTKAVEQQEVLMVQQGYVITWAIAEIAALLGMLDFFATGDRYYHFFFIIAACGMLLHFPRREPVVNAAFKNSM
jgi:hypothetical protein